LPKINTPQELDGYSFVVGGSLGIINGELIFDSETSELSAFRLGITASAISLIKNFDLYGSVDSSILTKFKKLNNNQSLNQIKLEREVNKLLKEAKDIQRVMGVTGEGSVKRSIYDLDDVKIKVVQSARLKSKYNFTEGCVAAADAKQINFILVHPTAVIARDKYSYINAFEPGEDSRTADNYLLQSRFYMDAFLVKNRANGIFINAQA